MVGENGMVRAWLAWNGPREIKKQSLHKAKGPLVEKQYAREALVAKSQLRVKENNIGQRALGLGPHCIRKCLLKRKNASTRWAKARLCRLWEGRSARTGRRS